MGESIPLHNGTHGQIYQEILNNSLQIEWKWSKTPLKFSGHIPQKFVLIYFKPVICVNPVLLIILNIDLYHNRKGRATKITVKKGTRTPGEGNFSLNCIP